MISSDEQFTTEHQASMNVRAMEEAIADLLEMKGESYGYAVVYRYSAYLASIHKQLGELLTLLRAGNLQKVS